MKKKLETKKAPTPVGPYSQGVVAGDFVFVSGQIPIQKSGEIVLNDIEKSTEIVLDNIEIKLCGVTRFSNFFVQSGKLIRWRYTELTKEKIGYIFVMLQSVLLGSDSH